MILQRLWTGWREVSLGRKLVALAALIIAGALLASVLQAPGARFVLGARTQAATLELAAPAPLEDLLGATFEIRQIAELNWLAGLPPGFTPEQLIVTGTPLGGTLTSFALPQGYALSLLSEDSHLQVQGGPRGGAARALPPVSLQVAPGALLTLVGADGQRLSRTSAGETLELRLRGLDVTLKPYHPRLEIVLSAPLSSLALGRPGALGAAGVRDGTLRIEPLPEARRMGPLDHLSLTRMTDTASAVAVEAGILQVDSRGRTGAITDLGRQPPDSLMPSWFDVLSRSDLLKACFAIASFMASLELLFLKRKSP